jgi:hypothetical protein
MKFHQRKTDTVVYRCPAYRNPCDSETGKSTWGFQADKCPLGAPCEAAKRSWFLNLPTDDNPRLNIPVPRDSKEFVRRTRERTSVERLFSGYHECVRDRTYRRAYLWEFGAAMYVLRRQLGLVAGRHRAWLDDWWSRLRPTTRVAA